MAKGAQAAGHGLHGSGNSADLAASRVSVVRELLKEPSITRMTRMPPGNVCFRPLHVDALR